jgi:hypothetical protein
MGIKINKTVSAAPFESQHVTDKNATVSAEHENELVFF